jgi:hypothetical protein
MNLFYRPKPILSLEAKYVIRSIIRGMLSGAIPTGVQDFSAIHDYTDPNDFIIEAMGYVPNTEADFLKASAIVDEVNSWLTHQVDRSLVAIQAGRPVL